MEATQAPIVSRMFLAETIICGPLAAAFPFSPSLPEVDGWRPLVFAFYWQLRSQYSVCSR